tara:strand:- start:4654 stop:5259 length:606 start_codon:yes stop_codon:yes gene_type:complete
MKQRKNFIDLNENPYDLFNKWYLKAKLNEINDPNAMNISTISKGVKPSSRIVLMKSYDKTGFVFYTNLESHKGKDIKFNNKVALNFYWKSILKQIRIEGTASLIDDEIADKYFDTRQEISKIGAWASSQSSKLNNRKDLEMKIVEYKKKFKNKRIPRPSFWSGFKIKPVLFEFWQDIEFRLHDRVEFRILKNKWKSRRLFP